MASPMDWTPIRQTRGIKRRSDGTMIVAPCTSYHTGYMPGGWPESPPDRDLFARPEPDSFLTANAKRICKGLARCFNFTSIITTTVTSTSISLTTSSVNTIVRGVRRTRFRQPSIPSTRLRIKSSRSDAPLRAPSPPPARSPTTSTPVAHIVAPAPKTKGLTPLETFISPASYPKLISPFPVLAPILVVKKSASPAPTPSPAPSPVSAQLLSELEEAAISSDSDVSSAIEGSWRPIPTIPVHPPPAEKNLSSNLPSGGSWVPSTPGAEPVRPSPTGTYLSSNVPSGVWSPSTPELRSTVGKSGPHSVEKEAKHTRAAARKLAAAQHNYRFDKLSSDWEDKVNNALKHGHKAYTTHDLAKVVPPPHMKNNEMNAWLNDEVINGYLKVVCAHGNKDVGIGETPHYAAFSSFFMTNLMDPAKGPASVKRWAARAKVGGKNVLKADKIFIPINPGNHWTLLVVSPVTKEIIHYNSLRGSGARYILKVIEWLRAELGSAFVEEDWVTKPIGQSPQQTNISDCGVFTITTAKQIVLGENIMGYGAKDIPTQRRRIVAELVEGALIRGSGSV